MKQLKYQGEIAGALLFLAGSVLFMGILTSELFYPFQFNSRDHYISELAAALSPGTGTPEPSALIFNLTMMGTGVLVFFASLLMYQQFRKLLVSIPTALLGIGLLGVGVFPGNIAPWHWIFAMIVFIAGGVAALASKKIVSSPLGYIFMILGVLSLFFLFTNKFFIPFLGVGGTERWVFYPIVIWLTGLGGFLPGLSKGKDPESVNVIHRTE